MIPLVITRRLLTQLADGELTYDEVVSEVHHWAALCAEVLGW